MRTNLMGSKEVGRGWLVGQIQTIYGENVSCLAIAEGNKDEDLVAGTEKDMDI
jgi:hypothetical protein